MNWWTILIIFLAVDLFYYLFLWLNRKPRVEGYTLPITREKLYVWTHHTGDYDISLCINPIRLVDPVFKGSEFSVEIEVGYRRHRPPETLRLWFDGVKYDLCQNHLDEHKAYYSAIVNQSKSFIDRHDPVLETLT